MLIETEKGASATGFIDDWNGACHIVQLNYKIENIQGTCWYHTLHHVRMIMSPKSKSPDLLIEKNNHGI